MIFSVYLFFFFLSLSTQLVHLRLCKLAGVSDFQFVSLGSGDILSLSLSFFLSLGSYVMFPCVIDDPTCIVYVRLYFKTLLTFDLTFHTQGHPRLVNAISKVYSKVVGREINPMTEVLATAGAYEALFVTIMGRYCNPRDHHHHHHHYHHHYHHYHHHHHHYHHHHHHHLDTHFWNSLSHRQEDEKTRSVMHSKTDLRLE